MDEIFEVLRSRSDEHGFTRADGNDVDLWAKNLGLSASAFLDRIGGVTASKYHAGQATFEFCDSLINDLWNVLIERVGKANEIYSPELFYEVYDAFDAGEYHRSADMSDNPIADFTDPLIAQIVGKLN